MYAKIKHYLFMTLYLLLWVRFFLLIGDPAMGGGNSATALLIYRDWASFIAYVYTASYYIVWPVYWLYGVLQPFVPGIPAGVNTATVITTIQSAIAANAQMPMAAQLREMFSSPLLVESLHGYIDFLTLVSMIVWRSVSPLIDSGWIFLKNLVWNILIEFSFTRKKQAVYQDALEKRAADLMKLNVEYRNLSKEASALQTSVITDELTKVYNKRFFLAKIAEAFKTAKDRQEILSIVMMDIDHFKKLNDTYGHLMGDKVLQAVAQTAKRFTPSDCFCCRFGGEEFSLVMPGKNLEAALEITGKIHKTLPLLRFEEDLNLRVTSSFGMVVFDFRKPEAQALNNFEEMLKLADDELYRAKLAGRNCIQHHQIL